MATQKSWTTIRPKEEIRALRWDGDLAAFKEELKAGAAEYGYVEDRGGNLWIETMRGILTLSPGDYLIEGHANNVFSISAQAFNVHYVEVVETPLQ